MDSFDRATRRARCCARGLILNGTPAITVADAMICQAMAVWAAATDRPEEAAVMLAAWVAFRDQPRGY